MPSIEPTKTTLDRKVPRDSRWLARHSSSPALRAAGAAPAASRERPLL
jgi:hypothetical protein